MSLSQVLANKLQKQIDDLRNKQANIKESDPKKYDAIRQAIQSQIRQLQSQLDALK